MEEQCCSECDTVALRDTSNERSPLITERNDCATSDTTSSVCLSDKGHAPAGRRSTLKVTLCILLTELCERLTFYGMTGNLLLFCSTFLDIKSPWPSTISYAFQGTCYVVPLFGGWLSDAYLGRFNVIYGSGLIYFVGTVMIVFSSIQSSTFAYLFDDEGANLSQPSRVLCLVLGLILMAFGTGGIKANVSPFGADQVEQDGPRAVQSFFAWFFWFINLGALLSFTGIVYIQQNFDFVFGYAISAFSMFLSVVIFLMGKKKYLNRPVGGSQLSNTVKVIGQAIKNRKKVAAKNVGSWLDRAKERHGGSHTVEQVEDVKALLRIIPVFLTLIIHFVVYFQMQTTFLLQATYMKLTFNTFTFPAASTGLFCIVVVLVFIPLLDRFVYPRLQACCLRFTPLRRIGVGLFLAVVAICVAGLVEIMRKEEMERGNFFSQVVFHKTLNASSLSVFYQAPQFMIIGISDMFGTVAGLEFAYSQSPKCLQGLVMGFFLFTFGLGNYTVTLIVLLVSSFKKDWYPCDNPNQGNLEYFFFLLAVIVLLNFCVFLAVASSYKYRTPNGGVPRTKKKRKEIQVTKDNV